MCLLLLYIRIYLSNLCVYLFIILVGFVFSNFSLVFFAYIRLPNSSCVCSFDMSSIVVMYLLLFRIHIYFVKCAMHRRIMDCWFLYILFFLCVLCLYIFQVVRHIHYYMFCTSIYIFYLDFY